MRFLAVIITGLALIAPAAHAFELLNKIGLPKAEYFVVQQIYSGWWMVGLLLPLAFLANVGNAIALRADKTAMALSIAAAALIAVNLVIFALFTQPANAATQNWTVQSDNWEALRAQMGVFPCRKRCRELPCLLLHGAGVDEMTLRRRRRYFRWSSSISSRSMANRASRLVPSNSRRCQNPTM